MVLKWSQKLFASHYFTGTRVATLDKIENEQFDGLVSRGQDVPKLRKEEI